MNILSDILVFIKEKNDKLQQELTKLRHELHQANTDMKTTIRQKDQNNTQELKKMMKAQIEEYLKGEIIEHVTWIMRLINNNAEYQ